MQKPYEFFAGRHVRVATLALLVLLWPLSLLQAREAGDEGAAGGTSPVYVLTIDGPINPGYFDYMKRGFKAAAEDGAQLILIRLNTPGGLLTTTRDMVSKILESDVPVAVYVTPQGAHAASAGTFLLYAAHIAAMNESTNVGAATPIQMGPSGPGMPGRPAENSKKDKKDSSPNQDLRRKSVEDTAAFIRALAEKRGRNAQWAQRAVTEADSLTANEALEKNVIDYLASSQAALLNHINGKILTLHDGRSVTLATKQARVEDYAPSPYTKMLAFLTDPNVTFILFMIGLYGIILEFYNPGVLIPGVIGAISLVLSLFAMNILPVNMTGVLLVLLGLAFIAAEAFIPSFGILGIGGAVAVVVGASMMFESGEMPGLSLDWGLVAGVVLLGLLMLALVGYMVMRSIRKEASTGIESMIGSYAQVESWSGSRGRVRVQGEVWNAYSDEEVKLNRGDHVLIAAANGLNLKIRKES